MGRVSAMRLKKLSLRRWRAEDSGYNERVEEVLEEVVHYKGDLKGLQKAALTESRTQERMSYQMIL